MTENLYNEFINESYEVIKLINYTMLNLHKFGVKTSK
ncbi:hypothetical protein [Zhouia amylolytica]